MDSADTILEEDVQLDTEAIRQEQARRKDSRGQRAAEVAVPGVDTLRFQELSSDGDTANEESPLLPRDENDGRRASWEDGDEFAHLPWHKRPSIWWVLAPFFLMTCAFGGIIAPKINLILELVCRNYMSERVIWDPEFTMVPVDFNGGENDQCRIPEVQSRVSLFNIGSSLLVGGISAIISPKLGALSDRYGRKIILMTTSIGTIASEIITICAATYPETFPVHLILASYAIDGLTGSFTAGMAIANAYAADCSPPSRRNVAFGYFHGCLFTGIALGPIIAGYVVKATGRLVVIFWIMMAVHLFFILFIGLFVPESLSKKRQLLAREKHRIVQEQKDQNSDWISRLRSFNLLEPLKVLWPTGPGSSATLRRNLFFLAAIDTIVFGVAMGSMAVIITYTNYMFGWKSFESGRFMTIVNSSRVFCLLVILPTVTYFVRRKSDKPRMRKATGSDTFDLTIVRVGVLFDTLGYVGYVLARTGPLMILSGAVAAVGGIASPTLQSSLTKHVPADQTGQLLGATSLLHALARVVAPAIFSAIYAGTVKSFPQTVFVCLASTFGLAFLISGLLKTNVYFDEDRAAEVANNPEITRHDERGDVERLPIVGSIFSLFGAIGACLGLTSSDPR